MRHDFLSRYNLVADIAKMMLRNIFHTLLQDSSAAEYALQAEVDEHVAKAVLRFDDPELVLDLRRANGNPQSAFFCVCFGKNFSIT